MRKIWVIALANLAVIGLVLTAIITNVASACSSADGCGSAPPYIYVGLILVLLGCAGLFLLFRKWRGIADTADGAADSAPTDDDIAPKRKRSNKASRAEQREAESEAETSSRSRLGRIRGHAAETLANEQDVTDFATGNDEDAWPASPSMAGDAADWPVDAEWPTDETDKGAMVANADVQVGLDEAPHVNDPVAVSTEPTDIIAHAGFDRPAIDPDNDDEFGVEWPVDDMPAISPSKSDFAGFNAAPTEAAVTLPIMADAADDSVDGGDSDAGGHISLDQIFAGPSAMHHVDGEMEMPAAASAPPATAPVPQNFDACAPAGFPATVGDLRALIAVLNLDVLLDKQARDDIIAWHSVLAPLDDLEAVGPEDCEAFAQWIDALAERHNADLATTVAHALQQRGGGGHDPYRSAA